MQASFRDLINGLTPRQRIALVAVPLLVLAGLGLAVTRNGGSSETALLSGKNFRPDELEQARRTLHERGLFGFRVEGQQILVGRDELARCNAALIEQSAKPERFDANWDQAFNRKSLLPESDRERQERFDVVRAKNVITMIRENPQIADAQIVWSDPRQRSGFREARRTAIVSVTPRNAASLPTDLYHSLQVIVARAWGIAERDVAIFNTSTCRTYSADGDGNAEMSAAPSPASSSLATSAPLAQPLPPATKASAANPNPSSNRPRLRAENRPKSPAMRVSIPSFDSLPQWSIPAGVAILFALSTWTFARVRRGRARKIAEMNPTGEDRASDIPADLSREHPALAQPEEEYPSPESPEHPIRDLLHADQKPDSSMPELPDEGKSPSSGGAPTKASAPEPFRFLNAADPDLVLGFVSEEHPQTIALILSHLPGPLATKILSGLPSTKRFDVSRRISSLDEIDPDVPDEVATSLRNRIPSAWAASVGSLGGSGPATRGQSRIDRRRTHERLESPDSAIADRVRRMMFVFDDLLKLDGSAVASLVGRIDSSKWALALKGASEELKSSIFAHIPPVAAERLHVEMNDLGPVRLSDIAAAQQQIVAMVRRLEDAGEIVVESREIPLRTAA